MGADSADTPAAFDDLLDRYERLVNIREGVRTLYWDQQVMMPSGGAPARSGQLSAISATRHELLVDEEVGQWLDELEAASLAPEEAAMVREIRWEYDRAARVPTELVEQLSETTSDNQQIWQTAKAEDDFESFAPRLERLRELHIERATHIDPDKPVYEVLYEDGHPYLALAEMEEIFDTLRANLPPLIEEIRDSGVELAQPFEGTYSDDAQRGLCEAALDLIGYDRDRGRLDTAPHPFMSGNQFDARITTRFKPTDPMDALTATIHEYGHASYQHGLPQDAYGTPFGDSRRSIHESQSRFWENHVGRTQPFWEVFVPEVRDHLDEDDLTVRELYEDANRVRPDNLIRVEADELTYHLHIMLRCEIDRAFIEGEIDAVDIPALWNEKMDEYLGVTPDTDTEGCLQDIHWTRVFATFQSYTLGSMVAAQLDAAIREDLDVDGLVREKEFEPIQEWMTEHVHRHGQRYETQELVERATGAPPTAEPFVEYATEKFGDLYEL